MGYTHYWTVRKTIGPRVWARITRDASALFAATNTELAGEYDEPGSLPVVDAEHIRFNGVGEDGHETFILSRQHASEEFCKTNRKPYDKDVCAILMVAAKHAPRLVAIGSDGYVYEWRPAADFVRQVLGEGYAIPPAVEALLGA